MPMNTKGTDTRITEIYATLNAECNDLPYTVTVIAQLKTAVLAMPVAAKNTLSDSLHLEKHGTKRQRNCIRARAFIEALIVDPLNRRNLVAIKNDGYSEAFARKYLRETVMLLDPAPTTTMQDPRVFRPLLIGAGIGAADREGPGSIACFVRDRATNDLMFISNEHVLQQARLNLVGGAKESPDIIQPAKRLGGSATQLVGTYVRGYLTPQIDAGLVRLADGIGWENRTPERTVVVGTSNVATIGMNVWKRGSRTRITRGRITQVNMAISVLHTGAGLIDFVGQLQVRSLNGEPFQTPGDSGAALMDENNRIVGVLHGGQENGDSAIATKIDDVLRILDVDFA